MKDFRNVVGSISGFDEYRTSGESQSTKLPQKNYTLPEIVEEIRKLKELVNREELETIALLIDEHIHDHDNPHMTNLANMDTEVINELYNAWIKAGNTGTKDKFIAILFQYIEIAGIGELDTPEGKNKAISVAGVTHLLEKHNEDNYAHPGMFRGMFPGKAIRDIPVWSCHANVGGRTDLQVTRDSEMYYHRPDGYLDTVPKDVLAIDYIYHSPMFSIWEERTNIVPNNTELGSLKTVGGNINVGELIPSILPGHVVSPFIEDSSLEKDEHGYFTGYFNLSPNTYYSLSLYVLPLKRNYFTIRVPKGVVSDDEASFAAYRLTPPTNASDVPTMVRRATDVEEKDFYAYCGYLNNGWVRVALVFKAMNFGSYNFSLFFNNRFAWHPNYEGNKKQAGAIALLQLEQGINASPVIVTENIPRTRPKTTVTVPFKTHFNRHEGTMVIETYAEQHRSYVDRSVYEVGNKIDDNTIDPTLVVKQVKDTGNIELLAYNKKKQEMAKAIGILKKEFDILVQSYSNDAHVYGLDKETGDKVKPTRANITHIDTSDYQLTYAEALDRIINILDNPKYIPEDGKTTLIEFKHDLEFSIFKDLSKIPTDEIIANEQLLNYFIIKKGKEGNVATISYSTLAEIVRKGIDKILDDYNEAKEYLKNKNTKLGTHDTIIYTYSFPGSTKSIDNLIINDNVDLLSLGCSLLGTNQYNGYIKGITYYAKHSDILEVEFHKGEIADVDYQN